jgi:hypothetical protein
LDAEPWLEPVHEDLVVGSKRGLEAWDRDGNMVRVISAIPARFPRFVDDARVLVIVPLGNEPLSRGFRVEFVELQSGKRTVVSEVPEFTCAGGADASALAQVAIAHPGDVTVDHERGVACVSLWNAYREAATFGFELHVELNRGAVRRWASEKPPSCVLDGPVLPGRPSEHCVRPRYVEPEPRQDEFRIDSADEGIVVIKQGEPPMLVPGYHRELVSPSGYWVLLHGDVTEGDYVHRRLALLHLRTGRLYSIPEPTNHWPKDIARVGVHTVAATPIEGTREVVGESAVDWFGRSELDELLVIDDLVVRPGILAFFPEGEVAL